MRTKTFFAALALTGCMIFTGCKNTGNSKDSNDATKEGDKKEQADKAGAGNAEAKDSVSMTAGEDRVRAVKDGKPYTGEIWSEDGKTYVMKFKDGKSYEGILYHKNGKPAMVEGDNPGCFDEDGKEMTAEEFTVKYFNILEEAGSQIEGVFAKMKNMK